MMSQHKFPPVFSTSERFQGLLDSLNYCICCGADTTLRNRCTYLLFGLAWPLCVACGTQPGDVLDRVFWSARWFIEGWVGRAHDPLLYTGLGGEVEEEPA